TRAVGRKVQKIDAQAETQSLHPAADRELLVSDGVTAEVRFLAVHTPERIELVSVQQQLGARGPAAVAARPGAERDGREVTIGAERAVQLERRSHRPGAEGDSKARRGTGVDARRNVAVLGREVVRGRDALEP